MTVARLIWAISALPLISIVLSVLVGSFVILVSQLLVGGEFQPGLAIFGDLLEQLQGFLVGKFSIEVALEPVGKEVAHGCTAPSRVFRQSRSTRRVRVRIMRTFPALVPTFPAISSHRSSSR